MLISLFKGAEGSATRNPLPAEALNFQQYIENIKEGVWYREVMAYRENKTEILKRKLPAVTPSGKFKKQGKEGLEEHSGIICLDIDGKDNLNIEETLVGLMDDEYLYAMHQSVGGEGIAAYFRIEPDKHLEAYLALEKRLADKYHILVDPACKDIGRLRFVSFDPNAYLAKKPVPVFKQYLPKVKTGPMMKVYPHGEHDIEYILQQLEQKMVDLTDSYYDWCKLGFAIADKYGPSGSQIFHRVSAISSKYDYDVCERKYQQLCKSRNKTVTFATFMYMVKNAGVEIHSPTTKHIISSVKHNKLKIGQNGGHRDVVGATESVIKVLRTIDQVDVDGLENIVAQAMALDNKDLKGLAAEGPVKQLKAYMRTYDLRFNLITRKIELSGEPITDHDINNIFLDCLDAFGKKDVNMQLVTSILYSHYVSSYNPFLEWFQKNQSKNTEGNIAALARCIKSSMHEEHYVELMIRKWVCSLVASMHGEYSVIILVLCGVQGIGKTNFFRYLLPDNLRSYYGESKLDAGKDDEILMCKKIILCDDEFGGKSKQEAKKLKELSSKQTFSIRKPYSREHEDLNRYAVLCGTSNDEEVINDPTGNRRILPISVHDIDWEAYKSIDKDHLLMEAFRLYHNHGADAWQLTRTDIEYLDKTTKLNIQPLLEKELILKYYDIPDDSGDPEAEWYTNTDIKDYIEQVTKQHLSSHKLGAVLKTLGVKKVTRRERNFTGCYFLVKKMFKSAYAQRHENERHPW